MRNVKVSAFAIGAAVTAIGGTLYAHQTLFIDPETFSFPMWIAIVLFVIFGGMGIFWGPILGAILLTVLPEIFHFIKEWYLFVYGSVFIVMMIWRPQGIIDRKMAVVVARNIGRLVPFRGKVGRRA